MKTETIDAAKSVKINTVSLDGFIVKETLAKDALVHGATQPRVARTFTAADLWKIQKGAKRAGQRG